MQRAEELMQSISDRIPDSKVCHSTSSGVPIVVVERGEHPNGKHSIVWFNYPKESPLVLKVFSHHGDFVTPSRERRQYQVRSVADVVSLIEVLYRREPRVIEGKDRVKDVLSTRYASAGSLEEQVIELLADVIEFAEANDMHINDLVSKADGLFLED